MAIQIKKGNLLKEVKEGFIVHGCNAQGKFNAGFAKQVREIYPCAYEAYIGEYKANGNFLSPGSIITSWATETSEKLYVINAITQKYYGRDPNVQYVNYNSIKICFRDINIFAHKHQYNDFKPTINFPLIGAGLGGGDWDTIEKIIDEEIDDTFEKILWVL